MDKYNKTLGKFGEDEAVRYLRKNGYRILERNYSIKGGEIDIIARDDEYFVFVEVKTRTNDDFGGGFSAVTYTKQQNIIRTAQSYLMRYGEPAVSFDVISVNVKKALFGFKTVSIEHIKNAF